MPRILYDWLANSKAEEWEEIMCQCATVENALEEDAHWISEEQGRIDDIVKSVRERSKRILDSLTASGTKPLMRP